VLLIAILWAGGLGAILPGMKILISEEGLHGWAWRRIVEDRLGLITVARPMRGVHSFLGRPLPLGVVVDVVRVHENGSARAAGLHDGEWLIGLDDGSGPRLMGAYELTEAVAALPDAKGLRVAAYDPQTRQGRWVAGLSFAPLESARACWGPSPAGCRTTPSSSCCCCWPSASSPRSFAIC